MYNEEDKNSFSEEDIVKVINNSFNIKYTVDKIREIGITEKMADKGITYDVSSKVYKYNNTRTKADIANTKIVKFDIYDISKTSKTKFKVKYKKLVVYNPYEVLNYYNDLNIKSSMDGKEIYDTKLIKEYLDGKGKIKNIKNLITKDSIKSFGKEDGYMTIYFIIENDKLLIDNIK